MSVLYQSYVSSIAALGQFYGSVRSVLCQFYVRGYAPGAAPVCWRVLAKQPWLKDGFSSRVAGLAAGFWVGMGLSLPARAGYDARLASQPPREGGRFLEQNKTRDVEGGGSFGTSAGEARLPVVECGLVLLVWTSEARSGHSRQGQQ